jgi:hypothetical protein
MKNTVFTILAILCVALAVFSCSSSAQSFPYTVIEVDTQQRGQQFNVDREYYGSTPFFKFIVTEGGEAFDLTGWTFDLKYGYSRDATAMVSFPSTNFATITNNTILFNGSTNVFFEPYNGYYVALQGTFTNGGYTSTFAEGSMDVYYTPAGDPNVPTLEGGLTFKIVSIETFSAFTNAQHTINTNLQAQITTVSGQVSEVSGRVTTAESAITTLQSEMSTVLGWGDHAGLYPTISAFNATNAAQYVINTNLIDRVTVLEERPIVDTNLTTRVGALETSVVYRSDLSGGWFYPDWFSWSFSPKGDGVPDFTSISTNNDVIVESRVFDQVGGSYIITYDNLRSDFAAQMVVESSDETVATASEYRAQYVSPGTATITATLGDFSRSTNLTFSLSGQTNSVLVGTVPGSAVAAFANAIDSRITAGGELAVYSTYDHTTPAYVRNPNSWVADLDLTSVSPWNSTGGRQRAGILIGSDCILFANHYPIGVGATVRFVTSANGLVERTVAARKAIPYSDIMIARLSSAISTNDVRPALLLDMNQEYFMPYVGRGYGGLRPALWIDQHENAYAADLNYLRISFTYTASPDFITSSRAAFAKTPISGDSGSPLMLITAAAPVPIVVGCLYSTMGGPSTSGYGTQILAAAAEIGSDTNTIQFVDLDALGYPDYVAPPTF